MVVNHWTRDVTVFCPLSYKRHCSRHNVQILAETSWVAIVQCTQKFLLRAKVVRWVTGLRSYFLSLLKATYYFFSISKTSQSSSESKSRHIVTFRTLSLGSFAPVEYVYLHWNVARFESLHENLRTLRITRVSLCRVLCKLCFLSSYICEIQSNFIYYWYQFEYLIFIYNGLIREISPWTCIFFYTERSTGTHRVACSQVYTDVPSQKYS